MDIEELMKEIAAPTPWTFPGKEQVWHMNRSQIARLAGLVAEREREACANVCEAEGDGHRDGFGQHCAAIIRTRSNVEFSGQAASSRSSAGTQGYACDDKGEGK